MTNLSGDTPRVFAEAPGGSRLPDDMPLVVFHAMVRVHVPAERRAALDSAIRDLGRRRRLLHGSMEIPPRESPRDRRAHLLALHDSAGPDRDLALAEGHGRRLQPLITPL